MAELAGLSVAANVAQFVLIGLDGAKYVYRAYKQTNSFLQEHSELEALARSLKSSITSLQSALDDQTEPEVVKLLKVAKPLAVELTTIFDEVQRLIAKGTIRARIRLAWQGLWVKSDIDSLLARLRNLRNEVSNCLIEKSSISLGNASRTVDELRSIAELNKAEVSSRLKALHRDLVCAWDEKNDASEEKLSSLFEKMTNDTISTIEHCELRTRVERILQSLTFDTISQRRSDIPKAHQDTFRWALSEQRTTLPGWLREGKGVYWIQGKAGCGKSTLMKYLQQEPLTKQMLEQWAGSKSLIAVSHYFWAPGTTMQKNLLGLFRSLLFQILIKHPEMTGEVCPSRVESVGFGHMEAWTLEELERCFEKISTRTTLDFKLCCFIDGLDEFEGEPDSLNGIIRSISESDSVKVCVASRPWPEFQKAYGNSSQELVVHQLTREDIKRYAQDKLDESEEYNELREQSPDEVELLTREISDKADGVFLWVYLVVRELVRGLSLGDDLAMLWKRVRSMPRKLEDYFKRMLSSIEDVYKDEALSLLGVLAYTRRPLDTYMTFAHRKARKRQLISSNNMYRFPAHGITLLDAAEVHEWMDESPQALRANGYDPQGERLRVVARCKDLVHVSEEAVGQTPRETLHHAASSDDDEAGSSSSTGEALDGHDVFQVGFLHRTVAEFVVSALATEAGNGSHSSALVPIVTLIETYLELFRHGRQGNFQYEVLQWILALALEARQHSRAAYLHIMWTFCIAMHTSVDVYERRSDIQKLMLGATMVADVAVDECLCGEEKEARYREDLFWALHCRQCRQKRQNYADSANVLTLASYCFKRPQVPRLAADGTMGIETLPEVNLHVLKALMNNSKRASKDTFMSVWRDSVKLLSEDPAAGVGAPINIYEVCLLFIQAGAPREAWNFDALGALRTVPEISEVDPTGQGLTAEFPMKHGQVFDDEPNSPRADSTQARKSWFPNFKFWY